MSKKSTTAALKIIVRMMQYPLSNALVIRQTAETLKDSCYAQLLWAIDRLGVSHYWKATKSPLEIEYKPTKQKILFRGLDDAERIKSIKTRVGFLNFAWLEEASEISEDDFNTIDRSLRGTMPEGYYIQWLITFNPTDINSWLKHRFFDFSDEDVLALTTNYKCNEWLSREDIEQYEKLKRRDPEAYRVDGLGEWGLVGGRYFTQWDSSRHVVEPFEIPRNWVKFRSMDWGCARPYSCHWYAIDYDNNMYMYRESYGYGGQPNVGTGETASQVANKLVKMERKSENVSYGVLDSACWARTGVTGPTIAEEINNVFYDHKLTTFGKCSKGRIEGGNAIKERLLGNEQKDGSYKPALYIFKNCIHAIRTIPMLCCDKNKPEAYDSSGEDHCFVAGTMISTARGEVPIDQVTTDDYVLTRNGYRRVLVSRLTKKNAHVKTVVFSDGRTLTATGNHPIYVKGKGFVPLDDLTCGDISCRIEEFGGECQIDSAKENAVSVVCCCTEKRRADVYNLTVDEVHEYFANGFLVHNCADDLAYACMSRPWMPMKPKKTKRSYDGWVSGEKKKRSAWTY